MALAPTLMKGMRAPAHSGKEGVTIDLDELEQCSIAPMRIKQGNNWLGVLSRGLAEHL
jgi:hypothetical protein